MFKKFTITRGDLFGGITAGIVALPLCLAFGVASGLGAEAGLYGGIFVGIMASIFGGTPVQITGPTAPMTLIASTVVIGNTLPSGEINLPSVLMVFLLAGGFQVLFGVLRLGQFIRYLPYPVISGLMTGIGIIILAQQIFPLLGMSAPASDFLTILLSINQLSNGFNLSAAGLALATIILIYTLPRLTKVVPPTLIALIVLTSIAVVFHLSVPMIGEIPSGLPKPILPVFILTDIKLIIIAALQLAFLGAIDSLSTSLVADNMTKTQHNSNQELIGQGIGNMTSAIFGGIPAAGAFVRTAINIRSGARHASSGVIHGLFLLAVLLGLSGIVQYIPNAVLASILVTAGLGIIDYRSLKHIRRAPKSDVIVMLLVIVLTIFVDMIAAVAIGMIVASLIFMAKIATLAEQNTTLVVADDTPWADELALKEDLRKQIIFKHITGPLFFGFVSSFRASASTITEGKLFVLRMEKVNYLDQSGLYALHDVIVDSQAAGLTVCIVGLAENLVERLEMIQIIPGILHKSFVFENFEYFSKALPQILESNQSDRFN
ncbi:SulP family inorganic anion transporter [Thorsellia anophelis]|uniref:Sulfate permease, SulP family n=1 Tax=Thorsellia anophelis DSM 18579 TaxID=1123402 RepID=A0A1I0ATC5_9GAMM|nr:SulP family inorganic anion transporter [Thorsellia anophelis]SES97444.1 sulfate permease, SulP family [Thorsellia anophelis DSM 18579]